MAKELRVKSKAVLDYLRQIDTSIRSHSSSLEEELTNRVREHFQALPTGTASRNPTVQKRPAAIGPPVASAGEAAENTRQAKAVARESITPKLVPCTLCGSPVREDRIRRHMRKAHNLLPAAGTLPKRHRRKRAAGHRATPARGHAWPDYVTDRYGFSGPDYR